MTFFRKVLIHFALVTFVGSTTLLATLQRERPLSLAPEAWEISTGLHGQSTPDGGLRVRGAEKSSSLRWRESLPLGPATRLLLDVPLNAGELTVQAEWLTASGAFLGVSDLARLQGPVRGREIEIPVTVPAGTTHFGVKFWLAANLPDTTVARVLLRQTVDWPTDSGLVTLDKRGPDAALLLDGPLDHTTNPQKMTLRLNVAGVGSAHLDESLPYWPDAAVLLAVEGIAPRTGLSLQAVFFDASGDYLGDRTLVADLTQAGDYVTRFSHASEPPPAGAQRVTFKLWVSGDKDSAVTVNGLLYGRPSGAPRD